MAARTIDVPGDGAKNVTTQQACEWLGVSRKLFDEIAEAESDWLRPTRVGRRVLWDAVDIFAVGRMLERRSEADPAPPGGNS